MNLEPVAAAPDFDAVFWIVVVLATIVTQIIKAAKRGAKPAPREPSEPGSPQGALENFLRGLSDIEQPAGPPYAPPQVPPPVPRVAVQAPPQVAPAPAHAAPKAPLPVAHVAPAARRPRASRSCPKKAGIAAELMRTGSLRMAVLYREILGPPVAVRGGGVRPQGS